MVLSYHEETLNDRSRMERMENSFKGKRNYDLEKMDAAEGCRTASGVGSVSSYFKIYTNEPSVDEAVVICCPYFENYGDGLLKTHNPFWIDDKKTFVPFYHGIIIPIHRIKYIEEIVGDEE